jgi:hypothetical protein
VGLNLGKKLRFNLPVEVIGKLAKEVGAGHGLAPPFFCLK